jgi:hypothetical protein
VGREPIEGPLDLLEYLSRTLGAGASVFPSQNCGVCCISKSLICAGLIQTPSLEVVGLQAWQATSSLLYMEGSVFTKRFCNDLDVIIHAGPTFYRL